MLKVSERFLEKIKSLDRNIVARITSKNKVYTDNDINYLKLDYGAMAGESLQIGSTYSNSLEIEFCSVISELKEMDEVVVELGVVLHDAKSDIGPVNPAKLGFSEVGTAKLVGYRPTEYEYVNMGTFYIRESDPDRNEKKTTIKAADGFVYMEGIYKSKLPETETIRNIAIDIANRAGIKADLSSFNGLSTTKIKTPKNCTYRQAIGRIAQFECGYAHFNREGLLTIRKLIDPLFHVTPSEYFMKGLKKNELMYRIGGISCEVRSDEEGSSETKLLKAGSDKGAQIKISNNSMTQSLLNDIYVQLRNLNFYPFNLSWRGNPALEVGDWITFFDRAGNKFKSPHLSYSLEYRGGLKGTSSADTKAISIQTTQFKGPIQQKIDDLYFRVDAAGKNNVYDGIDEPKNPKEGDLWFKPNGPDTEIWIYTDSKWVMQTSTALDKDIKAKIENSTPSTEIVKTINLSKEMDGKEWLKIIGSKIWLTNQTKIDDAIITHSMISSVDAGTINVGTLDAGKIRVVNLDASVISSGVLSSIIIKGVNISGSTFETFGTDGKIFINDGKIKFKDRTGKDFGYFYPANVNNESLTMVMSTSAGISINSGEGIVKRTEFQLGRGFASDSPATVLRGINLPLNFYYMDGSTVKSGVEIEQEGVVIRGGLSVLNNTPINFYNNLNMNGFSITNQSDVRLKENIKATDVDGIKETKKLDFVEFDRRQNYQTKDEQKQPSNERELGLIAQHSPFLCINEAGKQADHYLSLDVNKQIMLNSLTNKQLIKLFEDQQEKIEILEKKLGI
ncbi:hypothetical protein M222_0749 [Enterococcus faecalis AZ19]|uniref:tail fiber domain-containing protein n=1 Tax=Enterococcus faecalis TaxID=1351 RepID=UPI0004599656|nr:tail fiber domain-containing protein [Enterococcus faecalis]KAJ76046.1 hypothetical protein M222_0749 [Enterococcus faecalis AZ19]